MAVEIKELVVRVVATDSRNSKEGKISNDCSEELSQLTSKIIQECVKEVLKIMERKAVR